MSMSTEIQVTELIERVSTMAKEIEGIKHLIAHVANAIGKAEDTKPGPATEWISADEACQLLGIPKSKSNTHRNRLTWLRQKGLLSRFGCRKPYTYSRKEVLEVLSRIQRGVLAIPARASR